MQGKKTGMYACRVAYGTKTLKIVARQHLDLIIQNAVDMAEIGLPCATRFDLDTLLTLPWTREFFGCWKGYRTPVIGALTDTYIRNYAYFMMKRRSV